VKLEGLGKLEKFIHLNGPETCDFPACSTVPYSLRYGVPTKETYTKQNCERTGMSAKFACFYICI
jgi:hypothetical protein